MNWNPTQEQMSMITGASDLHIAPPTRVLYGMDDLKYRDACGVSQSFLKSMHPTPAHACAFFQKKDASHFRVGRMVHHAILNPSEPFPDITCYPETYVDEKGVEKAWHRGVKSCKLWEQDQILKGKTVLSRDEFQEIHGCVNSLAINQTACGLLSQGYSEVSLFKRFDINGTSFIGKARIDWVPSGGSALVDVKTVRRGEGTTESFSKCVKFDGYGFQAAYYLQLWNACNPDEYRDEFVWIVVEKEAPFAVSFFYIDCDQVASFRNSVQQRIEIFADCIREGVFQGDKNEIQKLIV